MSVRALPLLLVLSVACGKQELPREAAPVDVCAAVVCDVGLHCEPRAEACARPPCAKRGACVPAPDENPCNLTDCPADKVCVVEQGNATCVSVPSDDESELDAGSAAR